MGKTVFLAIIIMKSKLSYYSKVVPCSSSNYTRFVNTVSSCRPSSATPSISRVPANFAHAYIRRADWPDEGEVRGERLVERSDTRTKK